MRYFTYIAEQAFKTSENGERLFYRGGPWSRPYIIPDAATEQRLYRKQVWLLRVLLGGMIVGQPFLFKLQPKVIFEGYWFVGYLIIATFVFWLVGKAVFFRDLRGLSRAQARLRLGSYYRQMADRHSHEGLALGFIACLAFVAVGVWMLTGGVAKTASFFGVVFFGLCAVFWGYALFLKMKGEKS